ncbi:MAG: thiamine-phosphate kinase, partial [Pseudomonadota bacterium]|nr:thiamine-phosphate kinase [Pseudomonadota bacterium]
GVLADLGHILAASGDLGACLQEGALPLHSALLAGCSEQEQRRLQLQGGDDYLLLFTLPEQESLPPGCYCLGTVEQQQGLRLAAPDGTITTLQASGWQHF